MGELLDLAENILPLAEPGEELEGYAIHRTGTSIQAGTGGVVRHVGRAETRGVGVRLLSNSRMGYASTADLSAQGLADTVDRARDNAAAADPDEVVALPAPEPVVSTSQLWSEALGQVALESKVGLTTQLARQVTGIDPQIRSIDTAEYYDESVVTAVASTRGVAAEDRHGYAELYINAIGETAEGSAGDYSYWCGRDLSLLDIESLAAEAVSRTSRLMGAPAKRVVDGPVVLDRAVVGFLLMAIGRACTGGALSSGRSAFAHLHGSPIGAAAVSLRDDGLCSAAPAAALIDDEGVPRRSTPLISDGVLVGAMHTTTTARAIGGNAQSTGNARRMTHKSAPRAAPSALALQSTCTLSDLWAAAGEATYLQQMTGSQSGISSVTGRVDTGAMGFRLSAGQPNGRLPTTAVATTLRAFLSSIVMVADDVLAEPGAPVLAATVLCAPGWLA